MNCNERKVLQNKNTEADNEIKESNSSFTCPVMVRNGYRDSKVCLCDMEYVHTLFPKSDMCSKGFICIPRTIESLYPLQRIYERLQLKQIDGRWTTNEKKLKQKKAAVKEHMQTIIDEYISKKNI